MHGAHVTRLLAGALRFRELRFEPAVVPVERHDPSVARRRENLGAEINAEGLLDLPVAGFGVFLTLMVTSRYHRPRASSLMFPAPSSYFDKP